MEDSVFSVLGVIVTGVLSEQVVTDLVRAFFTGAGVAAVVMVAGGNLFVVWKVLVQVVLTPRGRRSDEPGSGWEVAATGRVVSVLRTVASTAWILLLSGLAVARARVMPWSRPGRGRVRSPYHGLGGARHDFHAARCGPPAVAGYRSGWRPGPRRAAVAS